MQTKIEQRLSLLNEEKEKLEKNAGILRQNLEQNMIQLHQLNGHFNEASFLLEEIKKEIEPINSICEEASNA